MTLDEEQSERMALAQEEFENEVESLADEDALRDGPKIQPEYEALGIHPDTMTCVAVLSEKEAKEYVWSLAQLGIAAVASRSLETDDKRKHLWHVAVKGGLAYNPGAYFASISGGRPVSCLSVKREQHPMERD